jgi:outer membrane receptor protein involved in Fe transport
VVWRVAEQTRLRLNAGTSFRAPSQMESYLDLNQPASVDGVFVRTRGDQDLAPERIFTVEAGLHDASTPVHRLDVALYYNRVTDLIFVGDIVPERSAFDPAEAGFAVGTTTFTNLAPVYDGVGGEADLRLFPIDGLEVYTNAAVQRTFETVDGQTVPEGSASVFKGNLGVLGRLPGRVDLSGHVHYVSAQTWLLRDYNAEGDLIADAGPIPGRTLLVARGAWRPDKDERVELSATAWNVLALISGEGVREHPEGQLVAGRLFGALTWRF